MAEVTICPEQRKTNEWGVHNEVNNEFSWKWQSLQSLHSKLTLKWCFDKTTMKAGTMHDFACTDFYHRHTFCLNKTMSLELFVTMTVTMHELFVQFTLDSFFEWNLSLACNCFYNFFNFNNVDLQSVEQYCSNNLRDGVKIYTTLSVVPVMFIQMYIQSLHVWLKAARALRSM